MTRASYRFENGTRWKTPSISIDEPRVVAGLADSPFMLSTRDATVNVTDVSRLFHLICSDFFLTKKLQVELHALYLELMVDSVFKPGLAKDLTLAYKVLHGLYCRGIGTADDSIFFVSVQTFTTSSLVRFLGTKASAEDESSSPGLLTVLTESALQCFSVAGWHPSEPLSSEFWYVRVD